MQIPQTYGGMGDFWLGCMDSNHGNAGVKVGFPQVYIVLRSTPLYLVEPPCFQQKPMFKYEMQQSYESTVKYCFYKI